MEASSLHQLMNEMVRKPISIPEWTSRYPETETDVYLGIDPLLADLNKAHENARREYHTLKKKFGLGDPMVEVAADMADSAKCAYETRLIELRADRELQRQARRLLINARLRAERERREQTALYKARLFAYYSKAIDDDRRRRQTQRERDFILFILWLFYFMMEQTRNTLYLATDFSLATRRKGDSKQAA